MRLWFLSLSLVFLTAGIGWLVYFNPGQTSLYLSPDVVLHIPTVTLMLMAMAFGGFLTVLSMGFSGIRRIFSSWRNARVKKRDKRVRELLRQGVNAEALKRTDEAVRLYQKIILLDPDHEESLFKLGNLQRVKGNLDEAIRLHRKARALDDNNMEILLALAQDYESARKPEETSQLLNEIQRREGNNLTVLSHLRDLFVRLQQWKEAHDVQEKILRQTMSENEKNGEQAWLEGIKFELGSQVLKEGQYDRARKFFKSIVKMNAVFVPAHIGLANVLVGEGKLHDAAEFLVSAFESTASILLLHKLEDIYLDLGEPEKVIRVFQEALQRNSGDPVLSFYLGKLFYRLEMVDEAFEILNGLDPGTRKMPDLHKILGNLYLRKGDHENAVEEFKRALNLRKRVVIPYYCPSCDYHSNEWSGRCPRCKKWNSFSASPVMVEVQPAGVLTQENPA